MSTIIPDSFIVISDFHSVKWPYEKIINEYINKYDKIFILGDATDRGKDGIGTGGLDLLFDIKDLTEKYPDRVFYLPGNHDDFLYMALKTDSIEHKHLMIINGGEKTLEDLEYLKENLPDEAKRLEEWLGKQPLQITHKYNDNKYALAHALFDKKIYVQDKDFSLEKLNFKTDSKEYDRYSNILWFRKYKNDYDKDAVPSSDYTMIIGHTQQNLEHPNNLNLTNELEEEVKVVCVDGGINYTNKMISYDGKLRIVSKEKKKGNTKKLEKKLDKDILELHKNAFDEVIIESLKAGNSVYSIIDALVHKNFDNLNVTNRILNNTKYIASNSIRQIASDIAIEKPEYLEGTKKLSILLRNYIYEMALNHILNSLAIRYKTYEAASGQINVYLATNDPTYITEKIGKARTIANKVGTNNLKRIIKINNCKDVDEYIVSKLDRKSTEKR